MTTNDEEGQRLVLAILSNGIGSTDFWWFQVWRLAERVSKATGERDVDIVVGWRRHAEVMLEFGDELEVEQ